MTRAMAQPTECFFQATARALAAIKVATLDSVCELLGEAEAPLRAAAAAYLQIAVHDNSYPESVRDAVRSRLEACWDQEENLGVLLALEECLDRPPKQPGECDARA